MDAIDLIRYDAQRASSWIDNIVRDVTADAAHWRPPGTANSIARSYAHVVIWADIDITRHFYGRDPLIAGEWGKRLDCTEADPQEFARDFDWNDLRDYGREVHRQLERQIDTLTPDDLDREFQMVPPELGMWKGIDVYMLHAGNHVYMHGGEIAAIKGILGAEGYPPFMSLYS